ncbi:MAG: DNA-binding response regulator [Chloroflexi bacterium HGW-Chloroflexi-6]|nr:MAG: DNA-binding response regulator [Chloroflexi bacterium HGW-Chloroflexi-6]
MSELTLVIVDDHPLFRQGIVDTLSLEPDLHVIGQSAHGDQGFELIRTLRPDVAIVDVNLPGMNGQQITHELGSEKIATRIILLTAYDDIEQTLHAAIAGAFAYCSKDIQPSDLLAVIRTVAAGLYVINNHVMTPVEFKIWLESQIESSRRSYSEPGSPFHPLSDREMEVLNCVVEGMSNKEIASILGISHQTVKNHITSILRKFNVEDRTQAVVYALKRGWVKLRPDDRLQE